MITAQDAEELAAKLKETCPLLADAGVNLGDLIEMVVAATGDNLNGLEGQVAKNLGMTTSVAVALMVLGAQTAVYEAMPENHHNLQLYRAGRVLGDFMARQFAATIREKLGRS